MKKDAHSEHVMTEDGDIAEHEMQLPAISYAGPDRDLIKEIAMDIGKEVVAYIEMQYPAAVEAASSTFRLSVRNCILNQIMGALDMTDPAAIREHLATRKRERAKLKRWWKEIRTGDDETIKRRVEQMMGERQEGID